MSIHYFCMILLLRSMYSRSVADAFQIASFKRPSFRRLAHTTTNSNAALYLPNQPDTPITSIAAPMVAASDYAFRALARHYGCDLAFTQMFHARNLVMDAKNTFSKNHFDLYEYADNIHLTQAQLTFLKGSVNVPRWDPMIRKKGPLIVQLAGHDVDVMVRAAHRVLDHTHGLLDGIDVNLGCPQGIARKGHYGAFLMDGQPERVYQILSGLRQSLPASVAVSAKIRLPITDELLDDRIRRLIDTGINFCTVHGRTIKENKTSVRACHFDRQRRAVQTALEHKPGFPVVVNGGIESFHDIATVRRETGGAAVMSSEGLLEYPNIFQVDSTLLPPREAFHQQLQFARDYLNLCYFYPPLPGVLGNDGGSCSIARGHLFKFLHRYIQEHTDLRDRLSSHKVQTLVELHSIVDDLADRYACLDDDELARKRSSRSDASWYRRHRQGATPIVPKTPTESSEPLVLGSLAIADRKELLRQRIIDLRTQRLAKNANMSVKMQQ